MNITKASKDPMGSDNTSTSITKMTAPTTNNNSSESHSATPEDLEKGLVTIKEEETVVGEGSHMHAANASGAISLNNINSVMVKRRILFTVLIVLVGLIASAAFLSMGIVSLTREQDVLFTRRATDITNSIQAAWNQYETYGLWFQESCYSPLNETNHDTVAGRLGLCSREKFNMLTESVQSQGVEFQAVGMIPNVTNDLRPVLEAESKAYYAEHYPEVDYNGFVGFVPKDGGGLKLADMPEVPSYWPVHYMEPVAGNEVALDLDLHSHPGRRRAIEMAVETWRPVVTERIRLAQETEPDAFSVLSYNPGTKYKSMPNDAKSVMLSSIAVRVPDLIHDAAQDASVSIKVNIFDSTDDAELPTWMGGADIYVDYKGKYVNYLKETTKSDVKSSSSKWYEERDIKVADRTWVVSVTAHAGTFEAPVTFVILGGCIIMVASLLLAVWFYTNMGKMLELQKMKETIEAEKAAIILDTACRQAKAERQLNEYIAHEVRNPLCSAITALSFVSAATKQIEDGTKNEETHIRMRDDLAIIDASLQFINELLRNMLDMHRAADKQMKITKAPTDIRNDVLEPVAAILHLRGSKVKVLLDCPRDLCVMTDRMRLKQICLNLSINATKFVTEGYIRLRAQVLNGNVRLLVEDSGPGIPAEKRNNLFAKFQESLDLLNQGTGIGLCLCKHLSCLLGGDIWLDEEFDSGVPGCPGTRFVIDLATSPMDTDHNNDIAATTDLDSKWASVSHEFVRVEQAPDEVELLSDSPDRDGKGASLPENLKVLFVDDDLIIRRLFKRAINRIAPKWNVEEAANGETALHMCKSNEYDIIFMDQYMAAVEKQLLGTETVRALRAQGVKSRICGLSANDMADQFKENGANSFLFKPFPCEKEAFTQEILSILKDY